MATTLAIRTLPLREDLKFGVEVLDIGFAQADETQRNAIVAAFHLSGAVLLRNQDLSPDDLIDFIEMFGEPEDHTLQQYTLAGYPKIFILSNKVVDGRRIGAHNDGVGWHTDYSYKAEPVMSTMLYGVEVPPEGADTLLADMCAAFEAMPADRQEALGKLSLHHSYAHFMATREHGRVDLDETIKAANPEVVHPLIRTHPADGRKALWVSTGTVIKVEGAENPDDLSLLDDLVEFGTQERFVYRHKWQKGDLLMWDNRCTLHTGTLYDDKKYERLMQRLWVKGDKPR